MKLKLAIAIAIIAIIALYKVPRVFDEELAAIGFPPDLYAAQDQLTTLHIRSDLTNLRWLKGNLRELTIEMKTYNHLDTLPPTLEVLQLKGTALLDIATARLPHLRELHLERNNELRDLSALASLKDSLRVLTISDNADATNIPFSELSLEKLEVQVSSLPLASLQEILRIKTLKHLVMKDVKALGNLTAGLKELTQLRTLSLENTVLRQVPSLPELTKLTLKGNDRLEDFTNLPPTLVELNILGSRAFNLDKLPVLAELTHLTVNTLDEKSTLKTQCPRIETLTLEDVPTKSLSGLPGSLKTLRLVRLDKLKSVDFLASMNLEHLTIERCYDLDANAFSVLSKLTSLKTLSLKDTRIKLLDTTPLANLHSLHLEDNEYLHEASWSTSLRELSTIRNIALKTVLTELPQLKSFNWSGEDDLGLKLSSDGSVQLSFASKTKAKKLAITDLTVVDLSYNKIKDINVLASATSLQRLVLDHTNDVDLKSLEKLPNLKTLSINGTDATGLAGLTQLKELKL